MIESGNIILFSLPHFQIDQVFWTSGLVKLKLHGQFEVAWDYYQLQAYIRIKDENINFYKYVIRTKDENISFYKYIDNLILLICRDILGSIGGYSNINYQWDGNWLKLMKIFNFFF